MFVCFHAFNELLVVCRVGDDLLVKVPDSGGAVDVASLLGEDESKQDRKMNVNLSEWKKDGQEKHWTEISSDSAPQRPGKPTIDEEDSEKVGFEQGI